MVISQYNFTTLELYKDIMSFVTRDFMETVLVQFALQQLFTTKVKRGNKNRHYLNYISKKDTHICRGITTKETLPTEFLLKLLVTWKISRVVRVLRLIWR